MPDHIMNKKGSKNHADKKVNNREGQASASVFNFWKETETHPQGAKNVLRWD